MVLCRFVGLFVFMVSCRISFGGCVMVRFLLGGGGEF